MPAGRPALHTPGAPGIQCKLGGRLSVLQRFGGGGTQPEMGSCARSITLHDTPIKPSRVACTQYEDMVGRGHQSITIAMALQRHCAACNATLSCSACAGGLSCQSFGSVTRFDAGSMDVKQKRSAVHNACRRSGFDTNNYTRNCTLKTCLPVSRP